MSKPRPEFIRVLIFVWPIWISYATLWAQPCGGQWLAGEGAPGTDGAVNTVVEWDPDGSGPSGPAIVAAGEFLTAAGISCNRVAWWNSVTQRWSALGSGLNGPVYAACVLPNGDLIAGGAFTTAGGASANRIAKWSVTTKRWTSLGSGTNGTVYALKVLTSGDLIVGGAFTTAGGLTCNFVARWSDSLRRWSSVGTGMNNGVFSLANSPPSDEFYAGGTFTTAGGVTAKAIAHWNGSAWQPLGTGLSSTTGSLVQCSALAVIPGGDVVAGGNFSTAGTQIAYGMARWSGGAWHAVSTKSGTEVRAIVVLQSDQVVLSGFFPANAGVPSYTLTRWNGAEFFPAKESPITDLRCLASSLSGNVFFGGLFNDFGVRNVGSWDLSRDMLLPMGTGIGPTPPVGSAKFPSVNALVSMPNGDLIVGGRFSAAGGYRVNSLARWNGAGFEAIGSGVSGAEYGEVQALLARPSGEIVVGGNFELAGRVPAKCIASWDGEQWHALGSGVDGYGALTTVNALIDLPNGNLAVGGFFLNAGSENTPRVAQWSGLEWKGMGTGLASTGVDPMVRSFAISPTGDILAAGGFKKSGGAVADYVAAWDGTTWRPLAQTVSNSVTAVPYIRHVRTDPFGNIVASGEFSRIDSAFASGIATLNPTTGVWSASPLGGVSSPISVYSTISKNSTETIAIGDFQFAGSVSAKRIAKWNGATWTPYGSGLDVVGKCLIIHRSGELVVGGSFVSAGGLASANFARWTDTNIPWSAIPPKNTTVQGGETLILTATPASQYANVSVQWRRNRVPIADGPSGASMGGGTVTGAARSLESPTAGLPSTLTITNTQLSDAGEYTAIFSNACGQAETEPAVVTVLVPCPCPADFDASGGTPDSTDIDAFFTAWLLGDPAADADCSGGTPDSTDIDIFFTAWLAGGC